MESVEVRIRFPNMRPSDMVGYVINFTDSAGLTWSRADRKPPVDTLKGCVQSSRFGAES